MQMMHALMFHLTDIYLSIFQLQSNKTNLFFPGKLAYSTKDISINIWQQHSNPNLCETQDS